MDSHNKKEDKYSVITPTKIWMVTFRCDTGIWDKSIATHDPREAIDYFERNSKDFEFICMRRVPDAVIGDAL